MSISQYMSQIINKYISFHNFFKTRLNRSDNELDSLVGLRGEFVL